MSTLTLRLSTYDPEAKAIVHAAQTLADERGHREFEPLHLLVVVVDTDATTKAALERASIAASDVLIEAESLLRKRARVGGAALLSRATLDLLGRAEGEAARHGGKVSVRELLIALATETSGAAREVLRATGLSAPILRALLEDTPTTPNARGETQAAIAAAKSADSDPLVEFGVDLVEEARAGRFDPVIGRDDEIRRVQQVLARRLENHPLLVGEPGIGKSAIIRELASRIANDDVPLFLRGKRIVALDLASLVAGAKLRGQLEERMRALLSAVRANAGGVLLFLPDLGALSGQAMAAGDLLAAALSRGEVQVIAVATPDRMRKFLDDHEALSRRFVQIPVHAPSVDETVAILRGIVPRFEAAHGVRITDSASVSAASLARRYLQGVELPKGAIDLIDEASARVRVDREGTPAALDAGKRKLARLEMQLTALEEEKDEDATRARSRLEVERAALEGTLEGLRRADAEQEEGSESMPVVDVEQIATVVASTTGVPVSKMLEAEAAKLLRMETQLEQRVIGQDHAVEALARAVRRARVGLRDGKRPIGSFLFLGPTGVGKTELAKALAEFLFDDEKALTRLDMSEFMEKHMVARLLGAPPGYVDSDEGGFLTEAVRNRPYSVVLFDEMEKAHPDVFDILLQVLEDGRLTDSRGRVANFQDVVVLFTSNVGSELVLEHEGDNSSLRAKIDDALRRRYRPEFLNRIDEIVIFDPLSKESLEGIADIQLRGVAKMLDARRIGFRVEPEAKARLVNLGYAPAFGARPLRRAIQREILDPLASKLLEAEFVAGDTIVVRVIDEAFVFGKSAAE